jgi:hypothetical protein
MNAPKGQLGMPRKKRWLGIPNRMGEWRRQLIWRRQSNWRRNSTSWRLRGTSRQSRLKGQRRRRHLVANICLRLLMVRVRRLNGHAAF